MTNPEAATFEDYLGLIPEDKTEGTRDLIELMRGQLTGAVEDVRWGIAIFSRDGKDITGISARQGFYSLYVPDSDVVEKYVPQLGNVSAGKGCIRFKDLDDLRTPALLKMIGELSEKAGTGTGTIG